MLPLLVARAVGNIASAAATGQDISKAAINTAVQIAGQSGLADFKPTGDSVTDSMIASALTSGTAAQLTGGNVLQSAISGAVSGAQAGATATAKPTTIAGGTATADTLPGGVSEADLIAGIPTVPTGGLTLTSGVPGESTVVSTGTQTLEGAQPKTIATQAEANQQNFQYALADYYIQPNGTIYVVDRTTGELSQYQPGQGPVSAVAGGALQKAGSLMGREEQLPADAKYSGSLKTFDPATYAQGLSSTNFGTMALVGELDKDAPSFNLRITKNPDGTTTQTNSTTGDVVTFSATGQPIPERSSESLRTQLSAYVGGVAGGVQEAVGEYGKSILSAASAIGLPVERALQVARNLESGGQLMQSAQYRQQESDYLQGNRDAFTAYTQTGDKSKLYSDITENFKNNP
ncbi:MAG: hypothetical protein EBR82_54625, partial [Caulobacteraceae bacterium]|nr:hypothetical protein [Caulobacteraceae bacterium]